MQAEEEMKKSVDIVLTYIQQGVEFAKEQAPLVAQEYLRYWTIVYWIWLGVFTLIFLALVWLWIKWKRADFGDDDAEAGCAFGNIVLSCVSIVGIGLMVSGLIKIHTAPRVYLLDWLRSML